MVSPTTHDDDSPGQGSSALVLAGREAYADRRALTDLAGVSPLHADVLAVTYGRDAEGWLADWRDGTGGRSAGMTVVSPGEFARSAAAGAATTHELPGRATVEAIADPADLRTLGERTRAGLDGFAAGPGQCVLLFESLTDLLEAVPTRAAFGFVHLLVHQAGRAGALGWFYADPAEHSPATLCTVADLFDAVVRPGPDGWQYSREYNPADDRRSDGDATGGGA